MNQPQPPAEEVDRIIALALEEDAGHGDMTSDALLPPDLTGEAEIIIKGEGVFAGGDIARKVFQRVDPSLKVKLLIADGTEVKPEDRAVTISGSIASILTAERTVLNFLQRLSGIASLAARYVSATSGLKATISDTRKTTPGLRSLEKYAVRMGGGRNHRMHLGDGVLIKDNHLAALRSRGMSLSDMVARARQNAPPGATVEVEVTTPEEASEAAEAGADIVMLDNMGTEEMRRAISLLPKGVKTEASGGINLNNVRQAALTGVDIISIGALTHSPQALDISLEMLPQSLSQSG